VQRHAADIGRLVASCVGILDPGLVVLGGGVGQNPLVVEEVRRTVQRLAWPTEITTSTLGAKATVLGAVRLAADYALNTILGSERRTTADRERTPQAA
jgi:predicted NBD/HSP70 family sugar kinase